MIHAARLGWFWLRRHASSPFLALGCLLQLALAVYLLRSYASGRLVGLRTDSSIIIGSSVAMAAMGFLALGRVALEDRQDLESLATSPVLQRQRQLAYVAMALPFVLAAVVVGVGLSVYLRAAGGAGVLGPVALGELAVIPLVGAAAGLLVGWYAGSTRVVGAVGVGFLVVIGGNGFGSPLGRSLSLWMGTGRPADVSFNILPGAGLHVIYLLALLAGMLALLAFWPRPTLSAVVALAACSAVAASSAWASAAQITEARNNPAALAQNVTCAEIATITTCSLPGYQAWRTDWAATVKPVIDKAAAILPTVDFPIVQSPAVDLEFTPLGEKLRDNGAPDRLYVSMEWEGVNGERATALRMRAASIIVGLPQVPANEGPCVIDDLRAAIALWLVAETDPTVAHALEEAYETGLSYTTQLFFDGSLAGQHAIDLAATMHQTPDSAAQVSRDDWARAVRGELSIAEFATAAGPQLPEPPPATATGPPPLPPCA